MTFLIHISCLISLPILDPVLDVGELQLISRTLPITDSDGLRQGCVNANKIILVSQMFRFICIKFDCEYMSLRIMMESKKMKVVLERKKEDILSLHCKLYTIQNQSKLFQPVDTHSVIMLAAQSAV